MQTDQEDRNCQINSFTRNWLDKILSDGKYFHSLYDQNWFKTAIDKVETVQQQEEFFSHLR